MKKISGKILVILAVLSLVMVACGKPDPTGITATQAEAGSVAESDPARLYELDQDDSQVAAYECVEKQVQVLVLGGGGAGLTAAIAAREQGAEVMIVEKMPFLGGAASISGGQVNAGGSEYQKEYGVTTDSADAIAADLLAGGHDLNDPLLVSMYANQVGPTFDWLVNSVGVTFEEDIVSAPEHSIDRIFIGEGKAAGINQYFLDAVAASGTEVLLNTKATELIVEAGMVKGARAVSEVDQKEYEFRADVVILATGGFGNNKELLPESLQSVLYYGPVSSTGDGFAMAEAVRAKTQMMDYGKIYPNGVEIEPGRARATVSASTAVFHQTGAILVARDGKRLVNELGPYADIRTQMMEQPDQTLFLVMDQKAHELFAQRCNEDKYATEDELNQWLENHGTESPVFVKGGIEEVAEAAGIDTEGLKAQIEQFNASVSSDEDELGRDLTEKLEGDVFYLIEQKPCFATTLGGLCINENMQVLNMEDQAVEGLLVAGEIVGGLHGDDSMPSVCVSWAFTSGRLAGVRAAEIVAAESLLLY